MEEQALKQGNENGALVYILQKDQGILSMIDRFVAYGSEAPPNQINYFSDPVDALEATIERQPHFLFLGNQFDSPGYTSAYSVCEDMERYASETVRVGLTHDGVDPLLFDVLMKKNFDYSAGSPDLISVLASPELRAVAESRRFSWFEQFSDVLFIKLDPKALSRPFLLTRLSSSTDPHYKQ